MYQTDRNFPSYVPRATPDRRTARRGCQLLHVTLDSGRSRQRLPALSPAGLCSILFRMPNACRPPGEVRAAGHSSSYVRVRGFARNLRLREAADLVVWSETRRASWRPELQDIQSADSRSSHSGIVETARTWMDSIHSFSEATRLKGLPGAESLPSRFVWVSRTRQDSAHVRLRPQNWIH